MAPSRLYLERGVGFYAMNSRYGVVRSLDADAVSPFPVRSLATAVKFPPRMESAWLQASCLGFFLNVFVYHTVSLVLKSILKLRTC